MNNVFEKVRGKLIVSCQALKEEPLYSSYIMGRMAVAAKWGGASGIRANTVVDINEIKNNVDLPIIGIIKKVSDDSDVYITPTEQEVDELMGTGCDIIAMDATNRLRTGGRSLEEIFTNVRKKYPNMIFMADCSCVEDALNAVRLGFDCVGTTLVGYTEATKGHKLPATDVIKTLKEQVEVPIIAEGGIHYPHQLKEVLEAGAFCAVVGGAITRPMEITQRFIKEIE